MGDFHRARVPGCTWPRGGAFPGDHRSMRKTRPLRAAMLAMACSLSLALTAQAAEPTRLDIPAGDLVASLQALTRQSGAELAYREDLLAGLRTRGVRGTLTAEQALQQLLEGSGFTARRDPSGALMIVRSTAPAPEPPPRTTVPAAPATSSSTEAEVQELQQLTVTGTRIRGGTSPSPVITIGAERIQEEGFSDLGQVVRSMSQNFSGGQNPGVSAGAEGGGFFNVNTTGGSSVNLRGIGQDATLTLLNGRRMSYGGYAQSVDISAIPVEAVDRIEAVTDGASAIYGSDAVGGVVNVLLKRDFDGVAVGARYGEATQGGLATREYTLTAGSAWASGGLIATVKKASNDPIRSDQRDYAQAMYVPSTLYQEADLRSGLLSIHQSLGDSVELRLDALRTERDMQTRVGYTTFHFRLPTETTTSLLSPGIVFALPGDWLLDASASLGKDDTTRNTNQIVNATGATSRFGYRYGNESRMYEIGAEGPVWTAPGGDARAAIGAGYRHNDFLYLFNDRVTADGDEGSRFAYVELDIPLVGPAQTARWAHRLSMTAALRTEDYDSYGRVTTPKVGLIYSPTADWTMKASWGKSFKAPTLYQGYIGQFSYLYPAATFGGAGFGPGATALYVNGGNRGLSPERARTWIASIAMHPASLPGLEAELTAFHIDYTDRIIQPITSTGELLSSSTYADFIRYFPSAAEQAAVIGSTQFANYTGADYDPESLVAIIENRFVNATVQRVEGVDLSGAYRFDAGAGRLSLRGSLSWLDIEQALTPTSAAFDGSGVLFYPAKVNGRVGTVWSQGGFTASLFGNYKSGVINPADRTKGGSFTTFDTTMRFDTSPVEGPLAGLSFELAAQNLLDRAPPLYAVTSATNAPYDSTNYTSIGRFVSLSVTKRW
ncbi:TonB-dependent receptor domain-containing protein [Luteimonas sp. SDU82]|uniref:TonB-dependent receptor domain-containing protein n=1 Tax=Luteimonas sp. SDU82 TaxID=3422592 RepID=UPI003EBD0A91